MAWFSKDKEENKEDGKGEKVATISKAVPSRADLAHILMNPRITEKATMHGEQGVYTFDVAVSATKRDILAVVRKFYSVTPRMVRVVSVPVKIKRSIRTGKMGRRGGGKKAYVYLKRGQQITIS